MPFLDAEALESDPEGLAFLRSILKPEQAPKVPAYSFEGCCPKIDTAVEILVEAAKPTDE